MEKVFGPFSGYLAVVTVRDSSEDGTKFAASYTICHGSSARDPEVSQMIRKNVGGHSGSIEEATEIALQLARLQIAGLPARGTRATTTRVEPTSALKAFRTSWDADPQCSPRPIAYPRTMPCPLVPIPSGQA